MEPGTYTDPEQWECERHGYLLQEALGTGSFGVVRLAMAQDEATKDNHRLAQDVRLRGHGMVAIKILHKKALWRKEKDKDFVQKALKREVNILQQLDHQHVIYLYQCFETPERKYLVFEYAQEGQLSVFVQRSRVGRGIGLPEYVACRFTKQLVEGLKYVHGCGIVHRDIKDENILLDRKFNVKISDFGFATELTKGYMRDAGPMKRLETYCGSLEYMAPEILRAEPYSDAKYLARTILQVDMKRRPSLKRILAHPWLRRPHAWSAVVLDIVEKFKDHYQNLGSDKSSNCNAENIRQVDDKVESSEEEGSSDAGSFSLREVPGLDSDLDGRKAPSPLHTTPEGLSQDEPYGEPADTTADGRRPRRRRKRISLDKTSKGRVPEELEIAYIENQQPKKEDDSKMESPGRKQRQRAKRNAKQNGRDPKTEKEEDAKATVTDRKAPEKEFGKQRKASDDGTKENIKMAPSRGGQGNHVSAENRKSAKKRASRGRQKKELTEKHTNEEPSHVTIKGKERGTALRKTKRSLEDENEFQTKEAPVRTAVESVQDDYEYSDDFEEDSEEIEDQKHNKIQGRKKSVPERRKVHPQVRALQKNRAVKTALSSQRDSFKPTKGRQYSSAKARVHRGVDLESHHASPWYAKRQDSSPETLSPPPEELLPAADGDIEDLGSDASSFDLEKEAAVPLEVDRGSAHRVRTGPKHSCKRGTRLTGKRSEGAVGRRNIQTRKARKKLGSQRGNCVERVEVGGLLPPIDVNWKAGQLVGQLPSADTKPAGDVQRSQHTPHPKTGRIQRRRKRSGNLRHSPKGDRNQPSAWL
ncbi:PREDICTED: serine/threonine-protein kinase GIN4-like [Branchiostoma belcheri]|uniref:Serine/threonine-protein kinase GIN4-like n=1 Tax=Branchiostoma belcheri TaxID=7741 RepID=A0A6P5A1H8_BRABE|nr:PREDICTED: serine/threonine-protein kinase GIN4-like [Branchiostoma belcheri]